MAEKKKEELEEIEVKPFYHELKNEIIEPGRVVLESRYFLEHWLPILKPTLYAIVKVLRSMCYYNPETGEKRDSCFPSLQTIANKVGVSNDTIQRELNRPEAKEFVRKEPRYRFDVKLSKKVRTSNTYYVAMDDPLTPADQEKLRQMAQEKALEIKQQKERASQKVQSLQALLPKPQIAVQVSTANCGSYSDRKMRVEEVPLRDTMNQATNQKNGWLAQENQRGEESPLTPPQIDSYKLLIQKGIKPKTAKALTKQHDFETITEVIEDVSEILGVRRPPGLIIDRLKAITTREKQERGDRERFKQAELQAQREREKEWERMKKQKDKEIAEFHQWQQSHPGGSWSQFALATT